MVVGKGLLPLSTTDHPLIEEPSHYYYYCPSSTLIPSLFYILFFSPKVFCATDTFSKRPTS
jgi:hypothetical protein